MHPDIHCISLHITPTGKQFVRTHGTLKHTENLSECLLRLLLLVRLDKQQNAMLKIMFV
jgi:hypothetical protein